LQKNSHSIPKKKPVLLSNNESFTPFLSRAFEIFSDHAESGLSELFREEKWNEDLIDLVFGYYASPYLQDRVVDSRPIQCWQQVNQILESIDVICRNGHNPNTFNIAINFLQPQKEIKLLDLN